MDSWVARFVRSTVWRLRSGGRTAHFAALAPFLLVACQTAVPAGSGPMAVYGEVFAPSAYVSYCKRNADQCIAMPRQAKEVQLTVASHRDLARVHADVNRSVRYLSDRAQYAQDDYWTLPKGNGDCEDIALEKRRRLIALGYPRQALLLTVARTARGTGHMVLVVVTDRGDFVLDNLSETVVSWSALRYEWVSQQSRSRETQWVALQADDSPVAAAARTYAIRR